jgi:glycosyltransferase involved in cell wall biosynthesis
MRIAYLSGSYVPDRGADSMHVVRMCEAFAGLGHDVTLHARPGTEPVESESAFYGITHSFRIQKHLRPQVRGWGAFVYAGLAAVHLSRHERPDLIYAREVYGMMFAAKLGVPFVFESHWRCRLPQKFAETAILRSPHCKRLVVISDVLRRIYRQTFPWFPEDRIVVAHDAANVPEVAARVAPRAPHARLQVGYVGGFLPGYGLDVIASLARSRPQDDFHIVGGREELLARWRARTVDISNLKWHGFVAPSRLPGLYADFDVMLAPFQATTAHIEWISPMKLFEYMAHGKAIICSDFPVMREILTDGHDGLLVPATNLTAWSNALDRLESPPLRATLGENGRRKLVESHTWAARAKQVIDRLPQ